MSALLLAGTLLTVIPAAGRAQDESLFDAVLLDRLGFFETARSGARSSALGGGGVAWSEDLQSLTLNPAGLASIARIETQIGFRRQAHGQEISYFGHTREFEPASTGLDALGVAYPFPTYRGSFVLAGAVFRQHDAVMESLWEGLNAYDGDYEVYSQQADGGLLSWVGGAGLALSASTAIGFGIEVLHGELDLFHRFDYNSPAGNDTLLRDLSEDVYEIKGWRVHLGLQSRLSEQLQLGIRVSTPSYLNIDGESDWQELDLVDGEEIHSAGPYYYYFEEDVRLPYRIAGGLLARIRSIGLSAEFEYVDWNQTRVNGRRLKDFQLRAALQETLDQRYGCQIDTPRFPARIYLGYSRRQEPLRFLESGEFVDGFALLKELDVVETRQGFSGGIGLWLSNNLLLEGAYERETGKRRTAPETDGSSDYVQSTVRQRTVLTFSYRF